MKQIKQVRKWEASDGTLHTSKKEAQTLQVGINFEEEWSDGENELRDSHEINSYEFADWLSQNRDLVMRTSKALED